MNTRRQHYVSQSYLSAWTVDGQLYCLRAGKVFAAPTRDVAHQRDFYRLRDLTDEDLAGIEMMIKPMPEHLQVSARKLVRQFKVITDLRRRVEALDAPNEEALRELDLAVNNIEESMHSRVESVGMPFVKRMLVGDTSFLADDKRSPDFFYFLSLQNWRTKRVREAVLDGQRRAGTPITFERSWNVLSHIFAASTGWSLYSDRKVHRVVLLKNDTGTPLITGDQPLINLLGNGDGTPPEEMAWYYPLSPTVAMVLTEEPYIYDAERVDMALDDVLRFNGLILRQSHEQVYSISREQLEALRDCRPT